VVLPENANNFLHGKKTNKQVLIQINQDKSLFKTIKKQFEFFGHIRSKQPEHLTICGTNCGKDARGRPRKMYLNQLKNWLNLLQEPCSFPMIEKVGRPPAHWRLCLVQAMDLHDDDDKFP